MGTDEVIRLAKAKAFIASGVGRTIRRSAGLSLADIGRAIGADQSTVYRWEVGERHPGGELAVRYADFLHQLMSVR